MLAKRFHISKQTGIYVMILFSGVVVSPLSFKQVVRVGSQPSRLAHLKRFFSWKREVITSEGELEHPWPTVDGGSAFWKRCRFLFDVEDFLNHRSTSPRMWFSSVLNTKCCSNPEQFPVLPHHHCAVMPPNKLNVCASTNLMKKKSPSARRSSLPVLVGSLLEPGHRLWNSNE